VKLLAPLRIAMSLAAIATAVLMVVQFRSYFAGQAWPNRSMQALNRLALADRSVERDVLSARAGLFRNYDSVTTNTVLASSEADMLADLTVGQGPLGASTRRLAERIHKREDVVEQFKTDNALVQNALARFAATSESLPSGDNRVDRLAIELMRLTLHTGDGVPEATRRRLRLLTSGPGDMSRPEAAEFADQARLLLVVLPEVDRLLAELKALNSDMQIESVRSQIMAFQDLDATDRLHQLVGLAISATLTLLCAMTLILLLRLRARTAVHRAGNERLSATVSRILLDPMTLSLQPRIIRSLQELASHAGADRAFLVVGNPVERTFEWPGAGSARPGWATLLDQIDEDRWQDDLIERIVSPPEIGGGQVSDPRASAMLLRTTGATQAVLGFRRNDSDFELRPYVVAGLRVALAAILQAVERESLEGDRVRLERTLARARRMETVGAMASGIAHNFNNIMGAIAGFGELAIARTRPGSAVRRNLEEIELAVARAQQLAEQILSFGRRAHEQDVIAIPGLIDEIVQQLRVTLPDGVLVTVHDPVPEALVIGNTAQLQQVLINIGINGAHAMGGEGVIDFQVDLQSLDHPLNASHGLLEAGDYVIVAIADGGMGMGEDQVSQIFQPFYTTRPGGTGLGLSTAWEVVQDLQGTIDVVTEPGSGSRFSVWLPVLKPELIELSPASLTSLGGAGESVLLIADDASRPLLEEQLAILGYEPVGSTPVTDIEALLNLCKRLQVDAVLMVQPDEALTASLYAAWSDHLPSVPVLVASEGDVAGGGVRSLAWPLREGELAGTLKLALREKATSSRELVEQL
jgi:signal transduction histidine kinase